MQYPSRLVTLVSIAWLAACSGLPVDPSDGALEHLMAPGEDLAPERLVHPALDVRSDRGRIHAVHARTGVLVSDDAALAPSQRARAFLAAYGSVVGLSRAERSAPQVVERQQIASSLGVSVRLAQTYHGLRVFGGDLIVHMTSRGITGIDGSWIDGLTVATAPTVSTTVAREIAAATARKLAGSKVAASAPGPIELAVYRAGLVEPRPVRDHLAWRVEASAADDRFAVWIDAIDGAVLASYPLHHTASRRTTYAGAASDDLDPDPAPYQPGPGAACWTDSGGVDSPTNAATCAGPPERLYTFTGHTYDLFFEAFGRDSYDGAGIRMRAVSTVMPSCPNAQWNGTTTTFCPRLEVDDVVGHEWAHAYTQYTHDLYYAYQSGALNEAYSDIWGETLDLHNANDGIGGTNNAEPYPAGQRWLQGEDAFADVLAARNLWDPASQNFPDTPTSPHYVCGSSDRGGVHTNSSIPSRAYALLVDGTSRLPGGVVDGQRIEGIGFAKAAAIYFRAQLVHQTPTTNFARHADALELSCRELIGTNPAEFLALPASGDRIKPFDCRQVAAAMLATRMRTQPACELAPVLAKDPPPACAGASLVFVEDWADGLAGWTRSNRRGITGDAPTPYYEWVLAEAKPGGVSGRAAFARNSPTGSCSSGGDESGEYSLASPELTAPAGAGTRIEVRFDHLVETEGPYDGGNLSVSVAGGPFTLVPPEAYRYNAPNAQLAGLPSTNPNADEPAWSGVDEGQTTGSWGTTVIDLSGIVNPGDTFRLRYDFGCDGCGGVTGWYLSNVVVNHCPS